MEDTITHPPCVPTPPSQFQNMGVNTQPQSTKVDVESEVRPVKIEVMSQPETLPDVEGVANDNSMVPKMSLPRLFWFFFYNFGLFAWGGPVAQIALIKERLVIQDKWITLERFQRVFSLYQILPGPEAAELCMFFGCLSAGKLGGVVAGIAFILPGFTLMLVASYVYSLAGFSNKYFNASFRALQPIVAAMVRLFYHTWLMCSLIDPITDFEGDTQNCRSFGGESANQKGRSVPDRYSYLHSNQRDITP